jgi:predicted Zn-dependent protease with MMP-like domain
MRHPPSWDQLESVARDEVNRVLRGLPVELRDPAATLTVRYEALPGSELIEDGLEEDLLGLFVGPDFEGEDDHGVLPPQILLFLENLWDFAGGDLEVFREEVRTTYLHELGHYLGLGEEEIEERGLQ